MSRQETVIFFWGGGGAKDFSDIPPTLYNQVKLINEYL